MTNGARKPSGIVSLLYGIRRRVKFEATLQVSQQGFASLKSWGCGGSVSGLLLTFSRRRVFFLLVLKGSVDDESVISYKAL
jgi:hypothetical protein